jgi:hypothetical protein
MKNSSKDALGKYMCRLEDSIKTYLKEVEYEGVERINMAGDWDLCEDLINFGVLKI